MNDKLSRREFLRKIGYLASTALGMSMTGCVENEESVYVTSSSNGTSSYPTKIKLLRRPCFLGLSSKCCEMEVHGKLKEIKFSNYADVLVFDDDVVIPVKSNAEEYVGVLGKEVDIKLVEIDVAVDRYWIITDVKILE